LVEAVCHKSGWSVRRQVRIALLHNAETPLAHALEFARSLPSTQLAEILHGSQLPENVKCCLLRDSVERSAAAARAGQNSTSRKPAQPGI
jgi:hypothetical protein